MKKSFRPFLWALPIPYMALIWVLSSLPADTVIELPDSKLDGFVKESLHLVEFAILYFLFVVALGFNKKLTLRTSLIVALLSCCMVRLMKSISPFTLTVRHPGSTC